MGEGWDSGRHYLQHKSAPDWDSMFVQILTGYRQLDTWRKPCRSVGNGEAVLRCWRGPWRCLAEHVWSHDARKNKHHSGELHGGQVLWWFPLALGFCCLSSVTV